MSSIVPSSVRPLLALAILALVPVVAPAVEISLAQCPPEVRTAIRANLGAGRLDEIDRKANGRFFVEIDLPGRRDFDIVVAMDGTILRSEEDLSLARVPSAVRNTIRRALPAGARLDDLEEVTAGARVSYRVEIDLRGEKELHLLVSEKGLVLKRSQRN